MRLYKMNPRALLPVLVLFLLTCLSAGQDQSRASAPTAKKIYWTAWINPQPPVINGKLDDEAWAKVAWESGFVQSAPYEGREPSEKTAFKILYDDKNIYIGIRAFDSESEKIERRMSRRDQAGGDTVSIGLDSLFDHLTAFVFTVNAAGVKADQLLANDGQSSGNEEDMSWDPIWDVATTVDKEGWTAEMRIPLSQLKFGTKEEQVWGLQVRRTLFRKDESSDWQLIPRNSSGIVHLFGELRGLTGLTAPHQIEIMPYTVGSLQSYRPVPGNPFAPGSKRSLLGGVDGKVGVTSDLTMNFTINPDFGQVEADPSVVNLTAFETFYEEKRPFFVEGRNILHYQLTGGDGDFSRDNLFYSRRIGRSPQYEPVVDGYVDMPAATSILGAFKLTGKTKSGFSIGIMESVTSKENASLYSGGVYGETTVEPLTNYFALRAQKDYNRGATIVGSMLTAVNRRQTGDLDFFHKAAYSGGIDLYHSWSNKNYYVSFKAVASRVEGTADAILKTQLSPVHYFQRPDAGYLKVDPSRRSLGGTGGTFDFGKQGGGHWMYSAGFSWRSPGLDLNDIGYLRTGDSTLQFLWAGYRIYEPIGPFRSISLNFNQWTGWNFGGEKAFAGGNINGFVQFKNYWSAGGGYNIQGEGLSQGSLRGGPSLRYPSGHSVWFTVQSDMRKKIRFWLSGNEGGRGDGEMVSWNLNPGLSIIPSPALQISLNPMYAVNHNILQYVGTKIYEGTPRYVFGTIDQTTLGLTLRFSYCLTPDLTIQYYGMPFVSAGRYKDFKRITNSRARDSGQRYQLFGGDAAYDAAGQKFLVDENRDGATDYAFADPDFNFRQFRSNLVLRWEYVPGSVLYVVWSQGRTGYVMDGSFDFGRDFDGLFGLHPHNVFLVKFSYCFQL